MSHRTNIPPDALAAIRSRCLSAEGVYLVGGSVRDLLSGRPSTDLDLAVDGDASRYAANWAASQQTNVVPIGKPGKMIHRLVSEGVRVDIAPLRGPSIEDDLAQRDFTVNAMALSLETGRLIDPLGGHRDLEARVISVISEQAFAADPIRLLRAFRLSAELHFLIHPDTLEAVGKHRERIQGAAGERIWDELRKWLSCHLLDDSLRQMAGTGLLFTLMPEIGPLAAPRQTAAVHRDDHFARVMAGMRCLESLLTEATGPFSQWIPGWRRGGGNRESLLKLAQLLCRPTAPDAPGKPVEGQGYVDAAVQTGSEAAGAIAKRFRLAKREGAILDALVCNRTAPHALFLRHCRGQLSDRDLAGFFRIRGDVLLELVLLCVSDGAAIRDETSGPRLEFWKAMIRRFHTVHQRRANRAPLLNGSDLIERLGLRPNPIFRRLLETVEDARLAGEIRTQGQALTMAERMLAEHDGVPFA